jgi:hypothetical protein
MSTKDLGGHGDDEINQDHHNFISPFFFYLNVTINGKKVRGKCKRRTFNQQPTFESSFSSTILFFLFFCFFFFFLGLTQNKVYIQNREQKNLPN